MVIMQMPEPEKIAMVRAMTQTKQGEKTMQAHTMRRLVFLVLVISGILMLGGCQSRSDQLEAEFVLGYDNSVKVSEGNPLTATITNYGEELEAELQVLIHRSEYESIIYAKEFVIPENGTKDVRMALPMYTIQKEIEVDIVVGGRSIYEETLKLNKFIAPDQPIIAVVSDQPDSYKFLNSASYRYYQPDYNKFNTHSYGPYSSSISSVAISEEEYSEKREPIVFFFDGFDEMHDLENLKFFNYIYIGDNTNLKFGDVLEQKMLDWIEQGGTLIVETGEDYKRLYSFLPDSITNFDVEEIKTIQVENLFDKYEVAQPLGLAVGQPIDSENVMFYEEDEEQMAMYTKIGSGQIINLLVDMTQEGLSSQAYRSALIDSFIEVTYNSENGFTDDYYGYSKYSHMLRYIPVDRKPPYVVMAIVFVLYIILAGPVLYIILKVKDRRDLMWLGVPGLSVFCLVLLYIFGFGTRYDKPIVNSISEIVYEDGNDYLKVNTELAVFNNESGNLKIQWDPKDKFETVSDNFGFYGANRSVKGKITSGSKETYEVFDSALWSKIDFKVDKTLPMAISGDDEFMTINIVEDVIRLDIFNKSPFDLETAYVRWGNSYAYVGDLASQETTTIELTMNEMHADMYSMLDDLRQQYNLYSWGDTDNEEMRANVELLESQNNHYGGPYQAQSGFDEVQIVGINRSPVGYELVVNDEEPDVFSKNIMTIKSTVNFAEGIELSLPAGFIVPGFEVGPFEDKLYYREIEYRGFEEKTLFVYQENVIKATFRIPEYFEVESMGMKVYPAYLEYLYWERNEFNKVDSIEGVTYEIWNPVMGEYEEVPELNDFFDLDPKTYIEDNKIVVMIKLDQAKKDNAYDGVVLQVPEIRLEGRSK